MRASSDSARAISISCFCAGLRLSTRCAGSMVSPTRLHVRPCGAVYCLAVDPLPGPPDDPLEEHVLAGGEGRHQASFLVNDADPVREGLARTADTGVAAVDPVGAGVGAIDAGDDFDQSALAGAVLAKEALDLAAPQRQRHLVERAHTRKGLGDFG